jgi:hypothetical protein
MHRFWIAVVVIYVYLKSQAALNHSRFAKRVSKHVKGVKEDCALNALPFMNAIPQSSVKSVKKI